MSEQKKLGGTIKEPLPKIAVAMGDPVGIGPEIVVKALSEAEIYQHCVPIVIGDAGVLAEAPGWKNGEPKIVRIADIEKAKPEVGILQVIDLANVPDRPEKPEASVENGRAMVEYLDRGIELAQAGKVEAVVFAPLNKAAMKMAGFNYPDEYEYFASIFDTTDYSVIQVSPNLVLASVTLHASIREMPDLITRERIISTLKHAVSASRAAGIENPRIGVAALNPHAGEGCTLGTEERDVIRPAV
ncbi:MAG: PdxA family dehydrogenase, partial [Chloroflexota bacterium]